jgi:hypothetical protein
MKGLQIGVLVALVALLVFTTTVLVMPAKVETKYLVNETVKIVNVPIVDTTNLTEMANKYLEADYEETLLNDTAKLVVDSEMKTKDFKKQLLVALNNNTEESQSVEDYKDITVSSSKVEEVEVDGTEGVVKVTLKVTFFNDGDEEDNGKARLTVVFDVTGLSVDELEDAEASVNEMTVTRIYD